MYAIVITKFLLTHFKRAILEFNISKVILLYMLLIKFYYLLLLIVILNS